MSGFERLVTSEEGYVQKPLTGNLDMVDERNLTEAQPKDLIIGEEYLILDRKTNEKTKGKFKEVITLYDPDDPDDEDALTIERLAYVFEDPHGKILIESNTTLTGDNKDIDPFDSSIKFTKQFGVFIPKAKNIIMDKVIPKKIPEELSPVGKLWLKLTYLALDIYIYSRRN